jgi:hypothetical protein
MSKRLLVVSQTSLLETFQALRQKSVMRLSFETRLSSFEKSFKFTM